MIDIKTEWDDLTLHEVMHPLGVTNAVIYLVRDAAFAGFGGWSLIEEKQEDGCLCSILSNGINHYIAITGTNDGATNLYICQFHTKSDGTDEQEEWEIAGRALVQILDELIVSQKFNRLVD